MIQHTGALYTTRQAARYLGLSTDRVRQAARYLGIERAGRDYILTLDDIRAIEHRKQRR